MRLKIGDFIIIASIILVTVFIALSKKGDGDKAIIEINGETVKSLELGVDCEYEISLDYTNTVIVQDGRVFVKTSDCPDKSCVNIGKISKAGQVICCLPNKLVITVVTDKKEVDVVTG